MTAPRHPIITDVCLIATDIDAGIEFYTQKLDFTLRSRMPGFADFEGPGVIVAMWDVNQLAKTTGIPGRTANQIGHGVMLACKLDSPADIDRVYELYRSRGVEFYGPPKDYPWNARCIYFAGPSGEFWEFFAWYEGGEPGMVNEA
jgi:catechol 2,3-dioxygenase-like lactoylglutathione lyase family enzyme